jgi:hypothetical protein
VHLAELVLLSTARNEMLKEEENPFVSPLPSPVLPLNDAPDQFPKSAIQVSILVMLPWPMIGIAACSSLSLFEKSTEAIWMFGSVTMIFLFPLAFIVTAEWVYGAIIGLVWLLVLFLPLVFRRTSLHRTFHLQTVLILQSIFSAIQAGFGFLVVLGQQI